MTAPRKETPAQAAVRAREADWRDSLYDHASDTTAPRVAAWRALERARQEERAERADG